MNEIINLYQMVYIEGKNYVMQRNMSIIIETSGILQSANSFSALFHSLSTSVS